MSGKTPAYRGRLASFGFYDRETPHLSPDDIPMLCTILTADIKYMLSGDGPQTCL